MTRRLSRSTPFRVPAASLPALLAMVLVMVPLLWSPAQAETWRVFVTAPDRQLRSLVLEVTGTSVLPADSPEQEHRRSALADAKAKALEMARAELDREIALRNPDVRVEFLGNGDPDQAVFIHQVDPMAAAQGQAYQVLVLAEVVYVVFLPGDESTGDSAQMPPASDDDSQAPLELTRPQGVEAPPSGVDPDRMQQGYDALTRALQDRLRELLEQ